MTSANVFLSGWACNANVWHLWDTGNDAPIIHVDYLNNSAEHFLSLIDTLQQKIPHQSRLTAWSYGGLIALALAYYYPHKVNRLSLIATPLKFIHSSDWEGVLPTLAAQLQQRLMHNRQQAVNFFARILHLPKHYLHNNHTQLLKHLHLLYRLDARAWLTDITCPQWWCFAENDALVSLKNLHYFAARNYLINVLPNASHNFLINAPITLIQQWRQFINAA